jgi:hypothetical protein
MYRDGHGGPRRVRADRRSTVAAGRARPWGVRREADPEGDRADTDTDTNGYTGTDQGCVGTVGPGGRWRPTTGGRP